MKVKVSNLKTRSGSDAPNQFHIDLGNGDVAFQSYNSTIAVIDKEGLRFGKHWDYSRTTVKYLNQWLSDYGTQYHRALGARELVKRGHITVVDDL